MPDGESLSWRRGVFPTPWSSAKRELGPRVGVRSRKPWGPGRPLRTIRTTVTLVTYANIATSVTTMPAMVTAVLTVMALSMPRLLARIKLYILRMRLESR